MAESQDALVKVLLETLQKLNESANIDPSANAEPLMSYLYVAKPSLSDYLRKLETFLMLKSPSRKEKQDAGYLLEKIALLSFTGLKGYTSVKSFQSACSQYDLLISGDTADWLVLCNCLNMNDRCDSILIESKATIDKVDDSQFARLCNIIDINLTQTGIGVFFTLNGASDFPQPNEPRQRKIGNARLRQALFFAKTCKPIIVFDKTDILALGKNGSLPKIIKRKIKDIQELSGLTCTPIENYIEVDLPSHLLSLN
jgi:hypothetical protein